VKVKLLGVMALICIGIALSSLVMAVIRSEQWFEFLCIAGVACIGCVVMAVGIGAIQQVADNDKEEERRKGLKS